VGDNNEPRAMTLSLDSRASTTLVSRFSNAPVFVGEPGGGMCVCEAVCVGVDGAMVTSTRRWRRCALRAGWARARASFARRRMRLDATYGSAAARVSMRLRDETWTGAQAQAYLVI
jgi:hypothetical protein